MNDDNELIGVKGPNPPIKKTEQPVSQFMDTNVVSLQSGTQIRSAVKTLANHKLSGIPVVDNSGRLLGVLSEYDLLIQASTKSLDEPVEYIKEVFTLSPESTLKEAILVLYKKKLRRIPVVDSNRLVVGVVSRIDVLQRIIEEDNNA